MDGWEIVGECAWSTTYGWRGFGSNLLKSKMICYKKSVQDGWDEKVGAELKKVASTISLPRD